MQKWKLYSLFYLTGSLFGALLYIRLAEPLNLFGVVVMIGVVLVSIHLD